MTAHELIAGLVDLRGAEEVDEGETEGWLLSKIRAQFGSSSMQEGEEQMVLEALLRRLRRQAVAAVASGQEKGEDPTRAFQELAERDFTNNGDWRVGEVIRVGNEDSGEPKVVCRLDTEEEASFCFTPAAVIEGAPAEDKETLLALIGKAKRAKLIVGKRVAFKTAIHEICDRGARRECLLSLICFRSTVDLIDADRWQSELQESLPSAPLVFIDTVTKRAAGDAMRLILAMLNSSSGGKLVFGVSRAETDWILSQPHGFRTSQWDQVKTNLTVDSLVPTGTGCVEVQTQSRADGSWPRTLAILVKPSGNLHFKKATDVKVKVRRNGKNESMSYDQVRACLARQAEHDFSAYMPLDQRSTYTVTNGDSCILGHHYGGTEDHHLEWKDHQVGVKQIKGSLEAELAAFCNYQGGTVVLGVKDNGLICAMPADDERHVLNALDSLLDLFWPAMHIRVERKKAIFDLSRVIKDAQGGVFVFELMQQLEDLEKKYNGFDMVVSVVVTLNNDGDRGVIFFAASKNVTLKDGTSATEFLLSKKARRALAERLTKAGVRTLHISDGELRKMVGRRCVWELSVNRSDAVTFSGTPTSYRLPPCSEVCTLKDAIGKVEQLNRAAILSGLRSTFSARRPDVALRAILEQRVERSLFVLVIGEEPNGETNILTAELATCLALFPWTLVIDFNGQSEVSRAFQASVVNQRLERLELEDAVNRRDLIKEGTLCCVEVGDTEGLDGLQHVCRLLLQHLAENGDTASPVFLAPTGCQSHEFLQIHQWLRGPIFSKIHRTNVVCVKRAAFWGPSQHCVDHLAHLGACFVSSSDHLANMLKSAMGSVDANAEFLIPRADHAIVPLEAEVVRALKDLDVLYTNYNNLHEESRKESLKFYQGAPPTWATIAHDVDVRGRLLFVASADKRRQVSFLPRATTEEMATQEIRSALSLCDSSSKLRVFVLYHEQGAGGSTTLLRLAWDLRTSFPVARLLPGMDLHEFDYALQLLSSKSNLPVLVVADRDVPDSFPWRLQRMTADKRKLRFVVLMAAHYNEDAEPMAFGGAVHPFLLKRQLVQQEARAFTTALSRLWDVTEAAGLEAQRRRLAERFTQAGTARLFGLFRLVLAKPSEFKAMLEEMVDIYLKKTEGKVEEHRYVVLAALLRKFDCAALPEVLLPAIDTLPSGQFFSTASYQLLLCINGCWQPAVVELATVLLERVPFVVDEDNWLLELPFPDKLEEYLEHLTFQLPTPAGCDNWAHKVPFMIHLLCRVARWGDHRAYSLREALRTLLLEVSDEAQKAAALTATILATGDAGVATSVLMYLRLAEEDLETDLISRLLHSLGLFLKILERDGKVPASAVTAILWMAHSVAQTGNFQSHIMTTLAGVSVSRAKSCANDATQQRIENYVQALEYCDMAANTGWVAVNYVALTTAFETHMELLKIVKENSQQSWEKMGAFMLNKTNPSAMLLAGTGLTCCDRNHFVEMETCYGELMQLVSSGEEFSQDSKGIGRFARASGRMFHLLRMASASIKRPMRGSEGVAQRYSYALLVIEEARAKFATEHSERVSSDDAFRKMHAERLAEVADILRDNVVTALRKHKLFNSSMSLYVQALFWTLGRLPKAALRKEFEQDHSYAFVLSAVEAWVSADKQDPMPPLMRGLLALVEQMAQKDTSDLRAEDSFAAVSARVKAAQTNDDNGRRRGYQRLVHYRLVKGTSYLRSIVPDACRPATAPPPNEVHCSIKTVSDSSTAGTCRVIATGTLVHFIPQRFGTKELGSVLVGKLSARISIQRCLVLDPLQQ